MRTDDEAIEYYTNSLGFELVEDPTIHPMKRWVPVRPGAAAGTDLLLARAATAEHDSRIGNQAGGRVFLFLHTDDFQRDYEAYRERGVTFVGPPREEPYGKVAVFEDLYGNREISSSLLAHDHTFYDRHQAPRLAVRDGEARAYG